MLVTSGLAMDLCSERFMDALPRTVIAPPGIVGIDALPLGILRGQHAPLAATHDDVEHGIDYLAHIECSWATSRFCQGSVKVVKCVILNRSEGSSRTRDRLFAAAQSDNMGNLAALNGTLTEPCGFAKGIKGLIQSH